MIRRKRTPDKFVTWRVAGDREADLMKLHVLEDWIRNDTPIPKGARERLALALRRVRLNEYPARVKPRVDDRNLFLAAHTWMLRRCLRERNAENTTGAFARTCGIKKFTGQTAARNATRHRHAARLYLARFLAKWRTDYTRDALHATLRVMIEEWVRLSIRYGDSKIGK
jgi:hypothetical protein